MINNVLILGSSRTSDMFCHYLTEKGISHLAVGDIPIDVKDIEMTIIKRRKAPTPYPVRSHSLPPHIFFTDQLLDWLNQQQFVPEWVINTVDWIDYIEVEQRIADYYKCKNAITQECADFFTYKSVQDRICKQLGVPTLPSTGKEGLCIKRDWKASTHIPRNLIKIKWEPANYRPTNDEFAQAWSSIEQIYNLSFLVDDCGKISLYDSSKLIVERSMILQEIFPCILTETEAEQIKLYLTQLVAYLGFTSRLILYQLAKLKGDDTLYNLDWNCRVGADTINKRPGTAVGQFDLISGLWDQSSIPNMIQFNTQYRGNTVWYYNQHRFPTGEPLKAKPWKDELSMAWDFQIGSIDSITHSLVKLN